MNTFLSCDWGTSAIRLRWVEVASLKILGETSSYMGIAKSFALFTEAGRDDESKHNFYLKILQDHIEEIEKSLTASLIGIPVIISGMASSTIGMENLPYQNLPFPTDGSQVEAAFYKATATFAHDLLLISGVKSKDDVMRGEETQLIGCITETKNASEAEMFIFPGTHSKHILVQNNQVVGFKTYMTGEFFDLLAKQSILKATVTENVNLQDPGCRESFKNGVADAQNANLLHAAFKVRVNNLFDELNKTENFNYLSGLLIGTELKDLFRLDLDWVHLCCGSNLKDYYELALLILNPGNNIKIWPAAWVDEAVIRGQLKIYKHIA